MGFDCQARHGMAVSIISGADLFGGRTCHFVCGSWLTFKKKEGTTPLIRDLNFFSSFWTSSYIPFWKAGIRTSKREKVLLIATKASALLRPKCPSEIDELLTWWLYRYQGMGWEEQSDRPNVLAEEFTFQNWAREEKCRPKPTEQRRHPFKFSNCLRTCFSF